MTFLFAAACWCTGVTGMHAMTLYMPPHAVQSCQKKRKGLSQMHWRMPAMLMNLSRWTSSSPLTACKIMKASRAHRNRPIVLPGASTAHDPDWGQGSDDDLCVHVGPQPCCALPQAGDSVHCVVLEASCKHSLAEVHLLEDAHGSQSLVGVC